MYVPSEQIAEEPKVSNEVFEKIENNVVDPLSSYPQAAFPYENSKFFLYLFILYLSIYSFIIFFCFSLNKSI